MIIVLLLSLPYLVGVSLTRRPTHYPDQADTGPQTLTATQAWKTGWISIEMRW